VSSSKICLKKGLLNEVVDHGGPSLLLLNGRIRIVRFDALKFMLTYVVWLAKELKSLQSLYLRYFRCCKSLFNIHIHAAGVRISSSHVVAIRV
jgi:hypothetical protein